MSAGIRASQSTKKWMVKTIADNLMRGDSAMNTHQKGDARMTRTKESQQGFTPGPHVVGQYINNGYAISTPQGAGYKNLGHAVKLEDAVLWAAAPELLEAATALLASLEAAMLEDDPQAHTQMEWAAWDEVRDLIAKAQGKG